MLRLREDRPATIQERRELLDEIARLRAENERLRAALKAFRSFVVEGGVPRYTVIPGAGLNSFIEEELDPLLRGYA